MDALLEAGEEEGVLDEEDRELVRSVVEFGDKVVREVMTPRPEMFAVAGKTSLETFTAEVNAHNFSRVPVYDESLDHDYGDCVCARSAGGEGHGCGEADGGAVAAAGVVYSGDQEGE